MNIRRLILDVDKAMERPTLNEIILSLADLPNVEVVNITVDNIDIETVGTTMLIEGENLNYDLIMRAIESTGAVVHSIDQIIAGTRIIEYIPRARNK